MEITPIEPRPVTFINNVSPLSSDATASNEGVIICDDQGNLLDKDGKILETNPCPFAKVYNCDTKECVFSSLFIGLLIGIPLFILLIIIIMISVSIRRGKEKSGF